MKSFDLRRLLLWCVASVPLSAQDAADPARLVKELEDGQRAQAHEQLVALGAKAVPALVRGLDTVRDSTVSERLAILREIGPDAASAVPALMEAMDRKQVPCPEALLETFADLLPFRDAAVVIDRRQLVSLRVHMEVGRRGGDSLESALIGQRLWARFEFPADLTLSELIEATGSYKPYRVELAIELLTLRVPRAEAALPALRMLLDRPDPRVLMTERTVPIRCKAARAILAIRSEGAAADDARAVLQGRPAKVPESRELPARVRARVAELIVELAMPAKQKAAAANLIALGPLGVPALTTALGAAHEPDFWEAALGVLRELGPVATPAVPQLLRLLTILPADHSVSVLRTLDATAPWCRDVVPGLSYSGTERSIRLFGRPILGITDDGFCNAFSGAAQIHHQVMSVDPASTLKELQRSLESRPVTARETALTVLCRRGAAAQPLLPVLAQMLETEQPKREVAKWMGDSVKCDRTDVVHRLAAQAILAIAAADDPLVAKAREVLARVPEEQPQGK